MRTLLAVDCCIQTRGWITRSNISNSSAAPTNLEALFPPVQVKKINKNVRINKKLSFVIKNSSILLYNGSLNF